MRKIRKVLFKKMVKFYIMYKENQLREKILSLMKLDIVLTKTDI